jgi:hypothetical protein
MADRASFDRQCDDRVARRPYRPFGSYGTRRAGRAIGTVVAFTAGEA